MLDLYLFTKDFIEIKLQRTYCVNLCFIVLTSRCSFLSLGFTGGFSFRCPLQLLSRLQVAFFAKPLVPQELGVHLEYFYAKLKFLKPLSGLLKYLPKCVKSVK